jgi:ABC-type transport system involved in multi-copper enzyme maturation permease subunit
MIKNLFWKEWQENRWKLGFCLGVSLAFAVMLFRIRLITDASVCIVLSWAQMFVIPIVYALDIFSGEMTNGTIHLLFKVPTARWKIFLSKYLVVVLEIGFIFLVTGLCMEGLGHGRETDAGYLLKTNFLFGVCAQLLFAWFCVFGCQGHSEAGALVAMFGVLIGWGIVFLWAVMCQVSWAVHCTPFFFTFWALDITSSDVPRLYVNQLVYSQMIMLAIAFAVACYRFVKVRRYL